MPNTLISTDVNLPKLIRYRINELIKMKLTPSTINLMIKDILLNNDFKHNVVKYINIILEKEFSNINKIQKISKQNKSNYITGNVHKNQRIDNLLNLQKIFLSSTNNKNDDQKKESKTLNFEELRKAHQAKTNNLNTKETLKTTEQILINDKNNDNKTKVDLIKLFNEARKPNKLSNRISDTNTDKKIMLKTKSGFTKAKIIKKIADSLSNDNNLTNGIDCQVQKEKSLKKAKESNLDWNQKKLINTIFRYGRQMEIIDILNVNIKIESNNRDLETLNYSDDDIKSMPDLEINNDNDGEK
ncbi:hypothetical protein [Spiroplasma endosymbiont of Labia minor]|uniref:hypothetical protein n=1 Tax=Spiroplasma endosymbiont of Labia minor TaxID=3066305 RepID=UPI0030D39EAD